MVDLDSLRERLNIAADEHGDDDIIEQMERAAVDIVQTHTRYSYTATGEIVEYVTGLGTRDLYLSHPPVATDPDYGAIEDIAVLEHAAPGDDGTEIDAAASDGFVLRDSRLVRKAGGVWTLGTEYRVTYNGGYAADGEPAAVREAVMQIVAYLYSNLDKAGMRSGTVGANYSWAKEEEPVQAILRLLPYKPVMA